MKNVRMMIAVVSAALCLAGCASMSGAKHASRASADNLDMAEIYHDYAVEQLELGRNQLRAGAHGLALDALRRAARDPATAVPALNAMGVAYAKLGRTDVASRYFNLALAREPANATAAANLARLQLDMRSAPQDVATTKPASSDRSGQDLASQAAAPEVARMIKPAYGAKVIAESGAAQLQRVSAHEVRIGSRQGANSRYAQASAAVKSGYPVKMVIGSRDGRPAKEVAQASYPVRVRF